MSDLSQESPLWREWAESRHSVQQMREELERLRAENARLIGDHAAALRLVTDVRAAIGDDGERMQPELIEYCCAMKRDAERYRWLRNESWSLTHCGRKYPRVAQTVVITDPYMRVTLLAEEALDAAVDAAMGGGNGQVDAGAVAMGVQS